MRISPEPRRRRPSARERSRFGRGGSSGGRNLIRFRRNQEAFWREVSSAVLWTAIAIMLIDLAGTLHRFATKHLADRPDVLQWAFPAVALAAAVFCVVRVRRGVAEILDIRREQKFLAVQLRSPDPDDDVPIA